MAGSEKMLNGVTVGRYENGDKKLSKDLRKYLKGDVTIVCIGTDRSSGDSFAPFIGTMLQEKGYTNVIGTIDHPVHGANLNERLKEIPKGDLVLAIDSCLGERENIGVTTFNSGKVFPGAGVGKKLTHVGDFNLKGIINMDSGSSKMNLQLLSATRLSVVLKMAKHCVSSIEEAFPLVVVEYDETKLFSMIQ